MFSIEDIRSRIDPQLLHQFIVDMPFILRTYVESITYSYNDIQVEPVIIQNRYIKYAGRTNSPTVSIEFYEDEDCNTQKALQEWRSLIVNSLGIYHYPSEYKKDIHIYVLRGGDTDDVSSIIHCYNSFPTTSNPIRLSYSDNGRVLVGQTFEVDQLVIAGDISVKLPVSR